MSSKETQKLLLAEDDRIIALAQVMNLRAAGYEVVHVPTGEEAVERALADREIALVLMDIDLGEGIGGPEAATRILAQRDLPIVFLTAHAEKEMVDRVRTITRYGYVLKNSGNFVLHGAIEMALQLFEAQQHILHRERNLLRQLTFQRLAAQVSSDLMRSADQAMDATVQSTLARVGSFFGGDRCYLVEFAADGKTLKETHEWTSPGVASVIDEQKDVAVERFAWLLDRILAGDPVQIPDVQHLPREAQREREVFTRRGVQSFLAVPLVTAERTEGYLGFHAVHTPREWADEQIEQIRVLGEIMAVALARQRVQTKLALEQLLMNVLMEHSPDSIYFKDRDSRFLRVSRSVARLARLDEPDQAIGLSDAELFPEEEAREKRAQEEEILRTGRALLGVEEKETGPDGRVRWLSTTKAPLYSESGELLGLFGISRDVTDRRADRQRLEAYARDQDVLLREIHHRVRNSMNMIGSLVAVHDDRVADENERSVLRELQSRIRGMIALYDRIDRAADFRSVSAPEYLKKLLQDLCSAFGWTWGCEIVGDFQPCTVDSRVLFPLGLIVNELVTNALKYAFPVSAEKHPDQRGLIRISLEETDGGMWVLQVRDAGVGLPPGFSPEQSGGMGLGLVQALTGQVGGTFEIGPHLPGGGGTVATVRFPLKRGASEG